MTLRNVAAIIFLCLTLVGCSAGSTASDSQSDANKPSTSTSADTNANDQSDHDANDTGDTKDSSLAFSVDTLQTLNIALVDEPLNLDFTTTAGAAIPTVLMQNVYQTLVNQDLQGLPIPGLATSWSVDETGTIYTFDLADATFFNGDAFTSETAKFSLENVKNWTTNDATTFSIIKSIETPSPNQLVVTLSEPNQNFLFLLATHAGAMFTPNGMDDLANNPVGTGPYFVHERVQGDHITLRAKDPEKTNIAVANFKYFKDATAPVNALKTGDIDLIWYLQNVAQVSQLKKDFTVLYGDTNTKVMAIFNNANGIFKNKQARIAATHAIDKQAVLDGANEGIGEILESATSQSDLWNITERLYPYNPETAKEQVQALAENSSEPLTVALKVPTMPYATAAAELVADQLNQVGFEVEIIPSEFPATWISDVYTNKNYDMTIIAHVEPRDFGNLMNPDYYIGNQNQTIFDKVQQATQESSKEMWIDGMKQAVTTSVEDAVVIPLYNLPNTTVVANNVSGLLPDARLPQLVLQDIVKTD